jgi:hypothetical protein
MKRCSFARLALLGLFLSAFGAGSAHAQGVTTASITGTVVAANGTPVSGATVVAVHEPSGTRYGGLTRADGRYFIPGMRVGGPYRVTVTHLAFEIQSRDNVNLSLGTASDVSFVLRESAITVEGVTAVAQTDAVFSSERTGAATSVDRETIEAMPSISRRMNDFARLSPQYSGGPFGGSFAGQDNRLNNMTVDGSYFNNSFGLSGQPGDRTGVAPISLDAIEQVQISVAPYDVRQGNFVGAGINTVTRSGGNDFRGSLYHRFQNDGLVGTTAGSSDFDPGVFNFSQLGGWLSGPILQDRLFFFVSYENEGLTEPGTNFRANTGGQTVSGTTTRVLKSDLDALSTYLQNNFDYATGPYEGYDHETPATRFLTRLDFNVNDRNKLSLRYTHLDSFTDVLLSNSSSLGFGNRRTSTLALNFQNSNYQITENIRSLVGEWNSIIGANMANQTIVGFTSHDESRAVRGGSFFPMVDILEGGSTYTTFGYEPFTPNNELRYSSFQLQNNFTRFGTRHTQTFGISAEMYNSENIFFPGSQSAYVYHSLADFYADANHYLANPDRTSSPVPLRRFQVRWSNIPGQDKPVQPLEVLYTGAYAQNEWQVNDDLRFVMGARVDVPFFGDTGFENPLANAMTFRDETGANVQYQTQKLPDANPLFSPRMGINWDVMGNRTTQLRGGTGIFTGRPAYVWISNQIGENGVLTGFAQFDNIPANREISAGGRPFNPNPDAYKQAATGQPAASYGLAFTDPSFRFPQIWRSNIAIDQRLPFGLIGTGEFVHSRDVNGVYYINANLAPANTAFAGADDRPRWTTGNRLNSNVTSAVVLKNQNDGYAWHLSGSLERPFRDGIFVKGAYSYGEAMNTVDPGSIAFGSWNNNQHAGDPNNPGLGFSSNSPGHRAFLAGSYRAEYLRFGATTLSMFWEARTAGNASYVFAGDLNGDGGTSNDLIYIPRDVSEMNFQTYCQNPNSSQTFVGACANPDHITFTAAQQAAAWEAFIAQDPYLSRNRGQYAQRGAAFLPMVRRADFSVAQQLFTDVLGRRNGVELRLDILNVGNLINSDWGVGQRFTTTQPLIAQGADAQGQAQYRLRNINNELITESFQPTAGRNDVYQIQVGLRYTFN